MAYRILLTEQVEQIENLSLEDIKVKYLSCKDLYGEQVAFFEVSDEESKQMLGCWREGVWWSQDALL